MNGKADQKRDNAIEEYRELYIRAQLPKLGDLNEERVREGMTPGANPSSGATPVERAGVAYA
jgi:hypothetical protein